MRKQEHLIQGSTEWLRFRLEHNGASEAGAMLGISKLSSRNELLKIKSTGISKEFSDFVQRFVLDKGHEVEALARPIVESIIDDQLYPVTLSMGKLSASCDGLTGMGDIAFEHKQWNEAYAEMVRNGVLPEEHWPQCQQVLLLTAAEKLIFVISDGTKENMVWMWVYPDKALQDAIVSGWAQFDKDLSDYVHTEIIEPPKAEAIKDLPAVTVQVRGELTLCNIKDVTPLFDKFLAEAKTNLVTDEDFAQAEAEAKLGRETAKRCKLTAKSVVDQMLTISEVTRTLEEYAAKFDALALKQEKAVKEQKETRKATAKLERDKAYADHMSSLNMEINPIRLELSAADKPDFVGVMKGQRTLASLYNKLDTELARAKIAADAVAKDIRAKLTLCRTEYNDYQFLFNDIQQIIYKPMDDFKMVLTSRVGNHLGAEAEKLEAERERIRLEEQAKAQREAEAKLRAEQAEKDRIEREAKQAAEMAERERLERENQEMLELAANKASVEDPVAIAPEKQAEVDHVVEQLIDNAKLSQAIKGNTSIETVSISKSEYEELLRRSEWLQCLENAGVDNWSGIDYAKELMAEYETA